jgi:tetratricopeptide (TPR) repeat protein
MRAHQRVTLRGFALTLTLSLFCAGSALHSEEVGAELTAVQQLWVNSFDAERGGDYDTALEYTGRILRDAGDFYLPNLRMGWLHYLKEEYATAMVHYRKAAQLSPGALSALQGIMHCARGLGDVGEEAQMAKAILLLAPMNYEANLRLAALNYANEHYSAAGSYYRKLLSLYPEDLQIANGLAWCCLKEGLAKEAATLFRNVLVVHPNYLDAKTGLAHCLGTRELQLASINPGKAR